MIQVNQGVQTWSFLQVAEPKINQAHFVCLPSQASSHPLAGGRALLGRACQEQFLAPARQPPVSACLHQNRECAALHWLGCMVNALNRNYEVTITICCSEAYCWPICMHRLSCMQGLSFTVSQLHVLYSSILCICTLYNVCLPDAFSDPISVDCSAPGVGK